MLFFNTIISEDEKDTKNAETSTKQSASDMIAAAMAADYDLGRDVGQKVLFVIMVLGAIIVPFKSNTGWFVISSILGYYAIVSIFTALLKKKSEELLQKENAKRFLGMPPRIWNGIVGATLLGFMAVDFIKNFNYLNIVIFPIVFLICYGLLTKNATISIKESDPNRVGSKAWKEANGVERVLDVKGQWRVYRDKNGNYYEDHVGNFVAIPAPVSERNKK